MIDPGAYIEEIKNGKSIVEYLASKNHFPVRTYMDKSSFSCPLPGHDDSTPSFVVYENRQGSDSFFCFGCKQGGDIIQLYRLMEPNLSWQQIIKELGGDVNITDADLVDYIVRSVRNKSNIEDKKKDAKQIFGLISLMISTYLFDYIVGLDKPEDEFPLLEKIYRKVDNCIEREDLESLMQVHDFLFSRSCAYRGRKISPIQYRKLKYEHEKAKRELEEQEQEQ